MLVSGLFIIFFWPLHHFLRHFYCCRMIGNLRTYKVIPPLASIILDFFECSQELPEWVWVTGLLIMEVMWRCLLPCSPWGSFCLSIVFSAVIAEWGTLCIWGNNNTILGCFMALNYAVIISIFQTCFFLYARNFNPLNQFFS